MTANPDSALRQAEKAIRPWSVAYKAIMREATYVATDESRLVVHAPVASPIEPMKLGDLRALDEAHALITEALAQSQDKP